MKCPHCEVEIHYNPDGKLIGEDPQKKWIVFSSNCPSCKNVIIYLIGLDGRKFFGDIRSISYNSALAQKADQELVLAYPKYRNHPIPPNEVPKDYADDYIEASKVLAISPKSSAALSRRCLQKLIRNQFGFVKRTLADEVEELLASQKLPVYLSKAVDAIRNFGNFAAHPIPDQSTGEILDVESGEAEWCLEILGDLLNECFVKPAKIQNKIDAANFKLKNAGKPIMKKGD